VTSLSPDSAPLTDSLSGSLPHPTIAVLGEAILDFTSTADAPLDLHGHPGGSPLNTGVAAARQGQLVAALGQFSTDQFGSAIVNWLHSNQVSTDWAVRSDAPCAMAIVTTSESGAVFSFRGTGSADTLWDPQPRPIMPPSIRAFQLSMLSCLAPLTAQTSFDVLSAHRGRALILLDPTIRPKLNNDPAAWLTQLARFTPLAHIIKASDQDLEFLYPGLDARTAARSLLGLPGERVVILTEGGDGATVFGVAGTGPEGITVPAPQVTVVDTVGAGDTLAGALLAWFIDHGMQSPDDLFTYDAVTWEHALRFAATAAAITCTRAGADPPTKSETLAELNR
jgi:fructokinase